MSALYNWFIRNKYLLFLQMRRHIPYLNIHINVYVYVKRKKKYLKLPLDFLVVVTECALLSLLLS